MDKAKNKFNDIFDAWKHTSGYKEPGMFEVACRKKELEENLDEMWKKYGKGFIAQLPVYTSQVKEIKSYGFKVLRNSAGKHKIIFKEG